MQARHSSPSHNPLSFAAESRMQAAGLRAAQTLMTVGMPEAAARREARLLVEISSGASLAQQLAHPERALTDAEAGALTTLTERRVAGEPMAYLAGKKEFYGRDFAVDPTTLIPRPDSETLVATALDLLPEHAPARLLDLGTGTGCLLLSVLAERPSAHGLGTDRRPEAARLAAHNAAALQLQARSAFHCGDWFDALPAGGAPFDLILSNPPYVSTAEMDELMPEVRLHEPASALHGGADGLDAYRAILHGAMARLVPGGALLFEVGHSQAASVTALGAEAGFEACGFVRDLAGHARVVTLRRPGRHSFIEPFHEPLTGRTTP